MESRRGVVCKYFKVDPEVKRRFEAARRLLGERERDIFDRLLRNWLGEVEGLAWAWARTTPRKVNVIAETVNVALEEA